MKKMSGEKARLKAMRNFLVRAMAVTIAAAIFAAIGSRVCAAQELSVLHTFTGGSDGSYPDGTLAADAAGYLYGTTQIGGAYGAGTVFELSPEPNGKSRFSLLYTFTGGTEGGDPLG